MTYEDAKVYKLELEELNKNYSDRLNFFEKYSNGLTPDHVRILPEWQELRKASEKSFAELRSFNAWFIKTYKKEYTAERRTKKIRL